MSSKHTRMHTFGFSLKYQKDKRQQIMQSNQNTAALSNFRKKITRNMSKVLSGITQSSNQGNWKYIIWKAKASIISCGIDILSVSNQIKHNAFRRSHRSLKSLYFKTKTSYTENTWVYNFQTQVLFGLLQIYFIVFI